MPTFPIPYRIRIVAERLRDVPALRGADITIDPFDNSPDEAGLHPFASYDTARVFVRSQGLDVNVLGVIQAGTFVYQVHATRGHAPLRGIFWASIDRLDDVIARVAQDFVEYGAG